MKRTQTRNYNSLESEGVLFILGLGMPWVCSLGMLEL